MKHNRAWEIDALRGVAIILMSIFHIVFDLAVYENVSLDYQHGFWKYVGLSSAIMFMIISGISSTFSKNPIKRGLVVFAAAMLVTAASIPIMGEYYIRFGILHFFAAAMILKGITDKFVTETKNRRLLAAISIPVSAFLGLRFDEMRTELPFLFPFGIISYNFKTYDFYPLFPWLAFFSLGIFIGYTFYESKASLFKNERFPFLCLIGRHSLLVYLLHQPVIMLILMLVFRYI